MAISGGARALAGGAAAIAAVVAGVMLWGPLPKEPPKDVSQDAAAAPVAEPAPAATPEPEAQPPSVLAPESPRFDVVRADGAGITTIAGSGAPEVEIVVQVDGVETLRVKTDATGQFAGLLTLPPSEVPRVLSLAMIQPDGSLFPGKETVVLAPMPAAKVAEVEKPAVTKGTETASPTLAESQTAAETPPVVAEAPAALLVKPEGVEVLQTASAAPPAPVQIDSIAYAPDGAVLLGGRGAVGAVLRLYLDDQPLQDVTVAPTGNWQSSLPEVAPGLHRLRADQLGADGNVTARFETPFKRELTEALAAMATPPVTEAAAPAEPATTTLTTPAPEPPPVTAPAPVSITVQPGFTLWGIAETTFGDGVLYVQVFEANKDKIKNPDLIYPGQIFTVPSP